MRGTSVREARPAYGRQTYSVYEAKARLSEVLRHVKAGRTVVVTERGQPIAKIAPIGDGDDDVVERRLAALEAQGVLQRARRARSPLVIPPLVRLPGALKRFLKDRSRW